MPEAILPEACHVTTLEHPPGRIEVFSGPGVNKADVDCLLEDLPELWRHFTRQAAARKLPAKLGLNPEDQTWEMELQFVGNADIRALNAEYRNKDEATDVLSFTLTADSPDPRMWASLPVVSLGSVFVSLEWARTHAGPGEFERYALERVVHGWLHLLGQNHDTPEDYETVVTVQGQVLHDTFAG